MVVIRVNTDGDFWPTLENAGERLVLVDFFAEWCGPCRRIAPIFEQMSDVYSRVVFVKVDVDRCQGVAQEQEISAMPTFVFFRKGRRLDTMRGADPRQLKAKIEQFGGMVEKRGEGLRDEKVYGQDIDQTEHAFLQQILTYANRSILYEDPVQQALAISVIPVERLEREAREVAVSETAMKDELLLRLLRWFKTEFFSWVDTPSCPSCNAVSTTRTNEHLEPTEEELLDGGSRIESYRCDLCQLPVRFPRYNNPGKLIETRKGRCGEWANCFTLCAKAMGFEARFVLDHTDHVWTEVWSVTEGRWLHCDPCENVCDRPLLYERGWGKKLSYVLAFSIDEVVDVSWRYSTNHSALLARRLQCRESKLIQFLKVSILWVFKLFVTVTQ